jgi:transcriptional regulator NrdR family protein
MGASKAVRLEWRKTGLGLLCPSCGSNNLKTIDTRMYEQTIQRRRSCIKCDYRFNTEERIKCQ